MHFNLSQLEDNFIIPENYLKLSLLSQKYKNPALLAPSMSFHVFKGHLKGELLMLQADQLIKESHLKNNYCSARVVKRRGFK